MRKIKVLAMIFVACIASSTQAQHSHGLEEAPLKKLIFNGFGEIHYIQPTHRELPQNGKLNIHRLVVGMGYRFNEKFSFMTEVAYEHVAEVMIEQMYLNYKLNEKFQVKTGLLPVPMGIINQEHEPNRFNGVEHPSLNEYIIPTAWREIGIGIHGHFEKAHLNYKLYVMNGFASYKDNKGLASGAEGFRSARQEGIKSFIRHPNVAGHLSFDGIKGLELGASFHAGKTQSDLYNNVTKEVADSSILETVMVGFDIQYEIYNIYFRGEIAYANISNTDAYNKFTNQDLGKSLLGYYSEIAYKLKIKNKQNITPFYRYGYDNNQFKVMENMTPNNEYIRTTHTLGIGYCPIPNIILKVDYQWINDANKKSNNMFNVGANFVF